MINLCQNVEITQTKLKSELYFYYLGCPNCARPAVNEAAAAPTL